MIGISNRSNNVLIELPIFILRLKSYVHFTIQKEKMSTNNKRLHLILTKKGFQNIEVATWQRMESHSFKLAFGIFKYSKKKRDNNRPSIKKRDNNRPIIV